ncbi:MAG: 30S ribosomal protein S20 [Actinobacteria bacterium]|nr:30S ribosomal protein S20 [Actinomycetota bacterium]MCL6105026.1 30S ribosomal protein S20 [Actinomycetota bacterium]
MANIRSQIKRNKQNEKRRLRNKAVRSELKTRTKTAVALATSQLEDADQVDEGQSVKTSQSVKTAIKYLDAAVSKGIIHKNQARRDKSRLMRKINKLTSPRAGDISTDTSASTDTA